MNRLKLGLGLCLLSVFLGGCWDRLEIEDRAVVLGISIDEVDEQAAGTESNISHTGQSFTPPKNDMLRITAQIAVPGRIPLGPETGGGMEKIRFGSSMRRDIPSMTPC